MEETGQTGGMHCTKCGEYRLLSVFRVRDGKVKQPCKKCYLEYGRRHYQNNKQYYADKAKCHPCVDCGMADPRILDFDHVRGVKKHNVSDLKSMHFCWETIQAEIEKCDVRCSNCHRIKNYNHLSWRTYDEAS
jgi:hypothetical protein